MSTRNLSKLEWIERHGSGTLRHAVGLGCAVGTLYLEERVAFTFGRYFSAIPASRIRTGKPFAEGDCHEFTEGCWNIRRRIAESPEEDKYSGALSLHISHKGDIVEEGLGIILENPPPWVPEGQVVYCIVSPTVRDTAGKESYTGEIRSL